MLERLKKKSRRILASILSFVTVMTTFTIPAATALAADGTVDFDPGPEILYGDHFTNRMYFDGSNTAYCMQPRKGTPDPGTYAYELLPQGSSIRKALYYFNGGYGYEKITKDRCFQGWSDTDAYIIGHITLSYIYDGYNDAGLAYYGAPPEFVEKSKEVLAFIDSQPEPPESFQAFIIPLEGLQTIAGSWYKEPYGWIELNKRTANGGVSDGNGNYSLAGAQYGVYQGDAQVEVLTTDQNGYAKSGDLEEGSYTVREIKASPGYAIDTQGYDVEVEAEETTTLGVTEIPQNNPMALVLQKTDLETGETKPQGGASFEHAEFTMKFYVEQMDTDPAAVGKKPVRTWIFKTDVEGKVKFEKDYLVSGDAFYYQTNGTTPCLPLGTVTIQETKAPEGYFANEEIFVRKITGDGKQESVSCYQTATVPEQVYRGDLEFVKVADGEQSRLANVPFSITSKTTGESHVIVTDKNGYANTSSSWTKHSINTNAGTASTDGIWFGISKPNDDKGALIYDTYEIEEQRCKTNEGMSLLKFEVSVYKDAVTVQLGTLTNDHLEIGTTALDGRSRSHMAKADEKVTLVDTVEYKGLQKGQEYRLVGTLMEKETGEKILLDGKPVTAEKIFKAPGTNGIAEVIFTFDGISLKGKTVVVFEKLYQEEQKLAVHADLGDEGQTIYFPEIGTTAKDAGTEENIASADKEVTLVDTVAYRNLMPGQEYTVKGTLMDKGTGKPIEVKGKPVTAETAFIPEKAEGAAEVTFIFDGTEIKGKTVVVFEAVTIGGKEIAVHADIQDEGQTIYFPEIGTTARDAGTGSHSARAEEKVTIVDTVKYKNLIAGKEYKATGVLMDKETGKELLIGGKKVTAEAYFQAENTEGEVEVTFTFKGTGLADHELVVFEKLFLVKGETEKEVAAHEDLEDERQTIKMTDPERAEVRMAGRTTPRTGDESNVGLWIAISILALAGIAAFGILTGIKRKRKGQED